MFLRGNDVFLFGNDIPAETHHVQTETYNILTETHHLQLACGQTRNTPRKGVARHAFDEAMKNGSVQAGALLIFFSSTPSNLQFPAQSQCHCRRRLVVIFWFAWRRDILSNSILTIFISEREFAMMHSWPKFC